jgi:hypothetical protein
MDDVLSRRRVLEAGGVGAALSVAGCNSFGSQEPQDGDAGGDGSGGGTTTVTVFADVDQEELQSFQQTLQQQVQSGEIGRREAQSRAQEKQVELLTASVESFEERAAETEGLSVSDTVTESGVLLVEGQPGPVLGTLEYDSVHGLLGKSEFEQYSQAGQSSGSGQGGQTGGSGQGDQSDGSGGSDGSGEATATGDSTATEDADGSGSTEETASSGDTA